MNVGDKLPPIEMMMDSARLVMYAGATWDWHVLHHDTRYAESLGLDAPIVDGQMFGAMFAEQIQRHLGPNATIIRMALRFQSMVSAGESVEAVGKIVSTERNDSGVIITSEHRLLVGDRICSTATIVSRTQT